MLTAQEKKKDNIAEYLLYMWQIEDIIRAYDLNIDKLKEAIISKYNISDEIKLQYIDWYESLIKMMQLENVIKKGHLQINKNVLIRLADLHHEILKSDKFPEYTAEFYRTLPIIVELRSKSGEDKVGELETCFNALYGILLLKLQGKDISPETAIAVKQISKFIGTLAAYYKKNEIKSLFDDDSNENK